MESNETYIEKKIACPSCKTGIEFAIKLNNVNLVDLKLITKCSNCGNEITLTPTNLIGIITENKFENKFIEEPVNSIPLFDNEIDVEIPSDITAFFEDLEENPIPKENIEYNELEDNRKKREYINDIFS